MLNFFIIFNHFAGWKLCPRCAVLSALFIACNAFSALTLLVWRQEGHRTCENFTAKPLSHGSWY